MKILFLDWKSIGNEDIVAAFDSLKAEGRSIELIMYPFDNHIDNGDKAFEESFTRDLQKESPSFVMSFNYHPLVSMVCNKMGIKYVSWVYDNPAVRLYSYTLINPCNYVFLFDSQQYEVFASQGIKTVHYLPLAAATTRYDKITITEEARNKWGGQVSFVGSMYSDEHSYYDQIEDKLSDYAKGYLRGLMTTQMEIDGLNIIEKSLSGPVMKEMVDALGLKPSFDGVETFEYLYANYVINRKITAIERSEILAMIGQRHPVNLYTGEKNYESQGVNVRGKVDYYNEMPYVFKCSDINLNITLRSIQRGIPLRAMDVLGCGGFLLTNYQEDMTQFFTPGEDFVFYESRADLMDKIDYYLEHDDERRAIAEHGHDKVRAGHTYEQRVREILDIVDEK
ncbi:CgeB family protein [Butyrivibrio proteoclasticus]|uniref:CgeB family protein n=1 Tax=Butyrivibrio proteoclasticus TaxID=43305 RepID=UPI00047CEAF0|nr:glycosyltransferase [Butyrivibrio proteoclasticus]